MVDISEAFVAFDTSKMRNAVAIAESGRDGEVRYLGEIDNTETGTSPSRYRTDRPTCRIKLPRERFRPYVLSCERRLVLDVRTRVARIGRAEPHTRRMSRG